MNLTDLFVVFQISINSHSPGPLEEIYTDRESDGQFFYYVVSDKSQGQDSMNPKMINGNELRLGFEVSVNKEPGFVDFAKSEIQYYANADRDSFNLLTPMVIKKTPAEVIALYTSSGLSGVLLPNEFSESSGSWVEFSKSVANDESQMVFTYKEIENGQVKEIKALAKGEDYRVGDVYEHWQSLVAEYGLTR